MYFVLYKGKEKSLATQEDLLQKIQETNCDTIKIARSVDDLQSVLNQSSVDQLGNDVLGFVDQLSSNAVNFIDSIIDKVVEAVPKDFTSTKK